jgi:dynein assembly factor 2
MMSSASSTSSTIAEEDLEESSIGSKKSVRFNEVVQRQVYRTNSSILGQKHKNQKKAEQKRRRAAARRASEGDTPSSLNSNFGTSADENDNEDSDEAEAAGDSGLSMDEKLDQDKKAKTKSNSKKVKGQKRSKVAARFMEQGHHHDAQDLIFNLDF